MGEAGKNTEYRALERLSGLTPRVLSFCDWVQSLPAGEPFDAYPEFAFYADLSDEDLHMASCELARRLGVQLAERQVSRLANSNQAGMRAND